MFDRMWYNNIPDCASEHLTHIFQVKALYGIIHGWRHTNWEFWTPLPHSGKLLCHISYYWHKITYPFAFIFLYNLFVWRAIRLFNLIESKTWWIIFNLFNNNLMLTTSKAELRSTIAIKNNSCHLVLTTHRLAYLCHQCC